MNQEEIIRAINEKYKALGENTDTYLKGLLQAKPINYWDYIEVDTLLSLQKPRTDFKDEEIFIMYHQVTELVLKLMLHEIKQISEDQSNDQVFLTAKAKRLCRYTGMLITSFDIMRSGMSYDDYNIFRSTLAPASGFQSAQFRYIEIYCTRLINLIQDEYKSKHNGQSDISDYFEDIYWKAAGYNPKTREKTLTLRNFEAKYLKDFIRLADQQTGNTIEEKLMKLENPSDELKETFREFDRLYNVSWPLVHLRTAAHYLDSKGENKEATGGSEWKKYLHPRTQHRIFFPSLWTEEEINNWGKNG